MKEEKTKVEFVQISGARKKKSNWWKYLISAIICIIYLFPIYVIVVCSLKPITDLSSRILPPTKIFWDNYKDIIVNGNIIRAIGNTAFITICVTTIEMIVSCMAAYPIARNRTKANKAILMIMLGIMMIPSISIVVGVYSTLVTLGLISTFRGIILVEVAFGLPYCIYMFSNFIQTIPKELDEAAAIDGAGVAQTFFFVIFPLLRPITVSLIILQGVGAWNEYAYSLYILQRPEMYTVTLTVKQFFSSVSNDQNKAAAGILIGIIPLIIIYLVLQKYFVKGAIDSSVKG